MDRRRDAHRPRPGLPRRAVAPPTSGIRLTTAGLPRVRLRGVDHGRDRCARTESDSQAPKLVARLRAVTDLPVGVGLGVSNGDQAAEVVEFADAVIVGSAFVRRLLDAPDERAGVAAVGELARDLAAGVRRSVR